MENSSNNLTFLIVTEAIRELKKKYENVPDANLHIESEIFNLGKKPGFSITSCMCNEDYSISNELEAAKFLTHALSTRLFGMKGIPEFRDGVITISFTTLPPVLKILTSSDGQFSPDQLFWYRCYSNFIAGVFTGSLQHFGYKVFGFVEAPDASNFKMTFNIQKLESAWTYFSAINH